MTDPEFRVARVVYIVDATRADTAIIPLGVFAEASNDKTRGLALKARKALTADELALVHPALRASLTDPFAYLHQQFNDAWDNAGSGKALEFLTRRHSANLSVLAPKECAEKNWLLTRLLNPSLDTFKAKLSTAADREYDNLWDENSKATESEEVVMKQKKAA